MSWKLQRSSKVLKKSKVALLPTYEKNKYYKRGKKKKEKKTHVLSDERISWKETQNSRKTWKVWR